MSENPYRPTAKSLERGTPLPPSGNPQTADLAPAGLTVISILCLVLGVMGLFGSLMSFLGPIFVSMMETAFTQLADAAKSEAERAAHLANLKMARDNVFWGIVFGSINLVVAGSLICGGIFCLTRKTPKILQLGTLLAAVFALGRAVFGFVYMQRPMLNNMKALAENNPGQEISQWIGLIFGFVMALGMTIFYLYCHYYLKRQSVTDYFLEADSN